MPENTQNALVIVPTYNEAGNICKLIPALFELPQPLHVLVVDDHSPDGTSSLVEALQKEYANLHLVVRPGKLGLGTAYKEGFQYGLKNGFHVFVTMDADFSHNPKHIPEFMEKIKTHDVVVGSKYVKGGVLKGKLHRRMLSRSANFIVRLLLGVKTYDNTAGFRCYARAVLESVGFENIKSSGYSFLVEMSYLCSRKGFRVCEIPITFDDRHQGVSKISKNEILRASLTLLRLRFMR